MSQNTHRFYTGIPWNFHLEILQLDASFVTLRSPTGIAWTNSWSSFDEERFPHMDDLGKVSGEKRDFHLKYRSWRCYFYDWNNLLVLWSGRPVFFYFIVKFRTTLTDRLLNVIGTWTMQN